MQMQMEMEMEMRWGGGLEGDFVWEYGGRMDQGKKERGKKERVFDGLMSLRRKWSG